MLSKQAPEALFTGLESDRVEHKRSEKQSEAIRKNICAWLFMDSRLIEGGGGP